MAPHALAQSLLRLSAKNLPHAGCPGLGRRDVARSIELAAGAGRTAGQWFSLSGTGPVPPARATLATRGCRVHHGPVSQRFHAPVEYFSPCGGSDFLLRAAKRSRLV